MRSVPRGGVGGFMKRVSCEVNPESCEDTLDRRATPAGRCYTVMTQAGVRVRGGERTEKWTKCTTGKATAKAILIQYIF